MSAADIHHPDLADVIRLNLSNHEDSADLIAVDAGDKADCFRFLARTVVGQLLSAKAARTIWYRVEQLAVANTVGLIDLFSGDHQSTLREAGLSGSKYKTIAGLRFELNGDPDFATRLLKSDYADIKAQITSLWGFGDWSADMCAIFYCGLPDVFPLKDVAIINGLNKLCSGEEPEPAAARYAPYRSYLCKHIWLGFNTGYIK